MSGGMTWIVRKIHLYNVTVGLYMLDGWERFLFDTLIIVLLWFVFDNGSRSATDFYYGYVKPKFNAAQSFAVQEIISRRTWN